jgi:hypothetical protein
MTYRSSQPYVFFLFLRFSGLLTVVLIALKLTGNITWPWVWVLSPILISFVLGITFLARFPDRLWTKLCCSRC